MNLKFLWHSDFQCIIGTGQTNSRSASAITSPIPDISVHVLWTLDDKPVIMRARSWFSLCEDSTACNGQYLNANCIKIWKCLVREIIAISILNIRLQSGKDADYVRCAAEIE